MQQLCLSNQPDWIQCFDHGQERTLKSGGSPDLQMPDDYARNSNNYFNNLETHNLQLLKK